MKANGCSSQDLQSILNSTSEEEEKAQEQEDRVD